MKKRITKLSLSRETLRVLEQSTPAVAHGGVGTDTGTVFTCAACWLTTGPPSDCASQCVVCPVPEPSAIC